jgi:hypothetical protein
MKTCVTISRHWSRPEITTRIDNEHISLQIDLADFIKALKQEIGSVTFVFTQKEFESRLDKSIENILSKVKEESVKVI